ncbi:MAG: hypothetical protein P0Y65_19425 [Candidatus Devosia phytovorans]|uniref:Uncharacterized protein n=1 Tax=Candidatus Devosia phytovorans TaxID=3121372 RepID=A0AAJ5VVI6_9HYPH|nr:hypothetical protein [Devosia sp.]WEK04322.1 MAG: hypothetical protein P0Y65_19425 [Devosia sp.]
MKAMQTMLGSVALSLVLAATLATPTLAQKLDNKNPPPTTTATTSGDIDFGDDSGQWANDGECDDPRFTGTGSASELVDDDILKDATDCQAAYDAGTVTFEGEDASTTTATTTTPRTVDDIAFGDDSGEWANDGECDDPRFTGTGAASEQLTEDVMKDATDCQAAFEAGTVTLAEDSTSIGDVEIATPIDAINFGDDSSEWAKDEECDDPRFTGPGAAAEQLDADIEKDATDCRAAYEAGTVTLAGEGDIPVTVTLPDINFGDDSSEWANDGECDDPRFAGAGSASELLDADIGKDATDCQAALNAGTVSFVGEGGAAADVDYGDDTSEWANDGECDDPRFSGTGVASELLDGDIGHDATDCQAAVEAGTATYVGDSGAATTTAVAEFDFGSDWSEWANDGECDDLRFTGEGVDKKLLSEDMYGDATDCRELEAAGKISIRTVYSPEYAAGAPYDSSDIDFGDNTSDYADDDQCDDPRFEGPGVAFTLLDSDLLHDSADCKDAYENGTAVLREDA